MKIGIDAHSASHPQPGGFKTYAINLIEALTRTDHHNEYCLFTNRPLATDILPSVPRTQVVSVSNGFPVVGAVLQEQVQLPRRLQAEHCDVAHFLSNTGPLNYHGRHAVTIHDVIALIEPQGLGNRSIGALWQEAILKYWKYVIPRIAVQADAVVTVSEYEKRQIAKHLAVASERIFVTRLAPSPVFRPLPEHLRNQAKQRLHRQWGLKRPFVLTVGFEPRKNVRRVIEAYQSLGKQLQELYPLVIVCARDVVREAFRKELSHRRLNGIVVESLTHEELLAFYNLAEVLVFPSLRESFGLPPLEAMACGTPVIASNTSSLPEVLGDAALLVPPTEVEDIAGAMARVLTTPSLATELRERGLQRSRVFSWERTARETLAVYRRLAASPAG